MAKLIRVKQEIFGSSGATTEFGVFGSDSEGAAATSKDPALIQSLETFLRGLYGSTANASQPPRIQDMNALYYLFARQIAYGMQAGVPEWLATENYYANGSVVLGSNGKIYISKTGTDGAPNVNNNPVTDTGTNWRFLWSNEEFTALSDLSRVMQINGDGVPMIPDNAAGIEYIPNFATTDSWSGNNSSLSVSANVLKITASSSALYGGSRSFSVLNGNIARIRIRTSRATTVYLKVNDGSSFPIIGLVSTTAGVWTFIDGYAIGSATGQLFIDTFDGATAGDTLEISQEGTYLGSGLYDTPLYDTSCCNIFKIHGVLPVKGKRGLALSFNGAHWLEANNPVTGITGTLSFILTTGSDVTTRQRILSNRTYSPNAGLSASIYNGDLLVEGSEDEHLAYAVSPNTEYTVSIDFAPTTYAVTVNGVQVASGSAVFTLATSVLYIGRAAHYAGEYLKATIENPRYDDTVLTVDQKIRYLNGDDAVDSQQKSETGTPHALAVYGADGGLKAHGGAKVWDSSNDVGLFGPDGWPLINGPVYGMTAQVGVGLSIPGISFPALCALNATDVAFIDSVAGILRVYRWNGSTWSQVGTGLTIASGAHGPLCALNATDVAYFTLESLRVYRWNGATWTEVGTALTITGVIGAALCALNATDVAFIDGALESLRVYRWNGSTWSQVGTGYSIPGIDNIPALCALNATDVAFIDGTLESLRVYRWNGSTWSQVGTGYSIPGISFPALCALNATDVAFIDGALESLRVYRWNGSTWSQVGTGYSIPGVDNIPALCALNATDVAFIDGSLQSLRTYKTI